MAAGGTTLTSKQQLQINNTELSSLIELLRGKAAGSGSGGSVETCTIEIANNTADMMSMVSVAFSVIVNGSIDVMLYTATPGSTNTIDNVICNSAISITKNFMQSSIVTINLTEIATGEVYKAPATNGAVGTITVAM